MSKIIAKILNTLFGCSSSAAGAMVWSLVLHVLAFAATYAWWSGPVAPVSFSGNRFVAQLEVTFSESLIDQEIKIDQEIETLPELDSIPPVVDFSPTDLVPLEDEPLVAPPTLQLPDSPLQAGEEKPPAPQTVANEPQSAGIDEQTPPDLSGNRPPTYPNEAIRRRWEGVVLLRITIAASGQVEQLEVAKSSGHSLLDRSAIDAVSTWHARPAKRNGKPIATVELLPVRFKL